MIDLDLDLVVVELDRAASPARWRKSALHPGWIGLEHSQDYGNLIPAFRPELMMPLKEFDQELKEMPQRVKSTRKLTGVTEILIP